MRKLIIGLVFILLCSVYYWAGYKRGTKAADKTIVNWDLREISGYVCTWMESIYYDAVIKPRRFTRVDTVMKSSAMETYLFYLDSTEIGATYPHLLKFTNKKLIMHEQR